jgi:hypothetical protein
MAKDSNLNKGIAYQNSLIFLIEIHGVKTLVEFCRNVCRLRLVERKITGNIDCRQNCCFKNVP